MEEKMIISAAKGQLIFLLNRKILIETKKHLTFKISWKQSIGDDKVFVCYHSNSLWLSIIKHKL